MAAKTILLLSNGFAEDTVGGAMADRLQQLDPELNILALPVVGQGQPYRSRNIPIIGPCWELPSQGITYGSDFSAWQELRAGAVQLYLDKLWALWRRRRQIDLVVGIGDYLSIIVTGLIVKKPLVYLWVTLSHFDWLAKRYLKKYALMIFSRWRKWTHLPEFPVEFLGNPYLDTLNFTGTDLGLGQDRPTITVLPGSREPAYNNLQLICKVIQQIRQERSVNVVFALSPKIDPQRFQALAGQQPGWSDNIVLTDQLGDALQAADLVLGLAGAANEQAAGLGKPIVTFWGGGHSREEGMVRWHASRFLEGAELILPPDPDQVSSAILSLLSDSAKMSEMGRAGIEQNGGSGSTDQIAERIVKWLKNH